MLTIRNRCGGELQTCECHHSDCIIHAVYKSETFFRCQRTFELIKARLVATGWAQLPAIADKWCAGGAAVCGGLTGSASGHQASEWTCLVCQELRHKAFRIQPSLWGGGGLAPMPGRVLRSAARWETQALSGSQSLLLVTGFTLGQWQISPFVTNKQTDLCCWFFTVCWQTEQ